MANETGLVMSYGFEESSGNSTDDVNSVLMTNNGVTYQDTTIANGGNSFAYDGVSDHSQILHAAFNAQLPLSSGGAIRIVTQIPAGDTGNIFAKRVGSGEETLQLSWTESSNTLFWTWGDGTVFDTNTAMTAPFEMDFFITNSGSGGTTEAWINGVSQGTLSENAFVGNTANFRFASRSDGANFLNCKIAEANFWNISQVGSGVPADLYNGGAYKLFNGSTFGDDDGGGLLSSLRSVLLWS